MHDINAQMALRLHQKTGEPLAHCTYLLGQTNGDYETALKILERILRQRGEERGEGAVDVHADAGPAAQATLEQRVERLEDQLLHLTDTLAGMSDILSQMLDKLSGEPAPGSGKDATTNTTPGSK